MKTACFQAAALALSMTLPAYSTAAPGATSGFGPSGSESAHDGPVSAGETGAVGAQLTLPAGQQIQVVQWIVTGPNGASTVVQTGSVAVPVQVVSFLASSLPAGTGYRIALSGTAIDGSIVCTGSASFDIQARVTTTVSVALACSVTTSGSQVTLITGQTFDCANVTNVTAIPAETAVGGAISLTGMAVGPAPGAVSYGWSAPSGSFDQANSSSAQFTCTAPGPVPVTLTAADGPVPAGAACSSALSTRTVTVVCDGPQDAGSE